MGARHWTAALLGCVALAADQAASARLKLEQIELERVPRGGSVFISALEANHYAADEARKAVGDGIREPQIQLGSNVVTGTAWIDFVKVQTDAGKPPGFLMSALLRGEKHVSVTAKIQSGSGRAQVDVEQVTISGVQITGRTLDMLIEYYLVPRYPEVVIGRPFELRHNVDRFDISPRGVGIAVRK